VLNNLGEENLSDSLRAIINAQTDATVLDEMTGQVQRLSTQIVQTAQAISLKADKETLDALGETLGSSIAALTKNAQDMTGLLYDMNPDTFEGWAEGVVAQLMGMYEYSLTDDFKMVGLPFMDYSSAFLTNSKNEKFNDIPSLVAYMKEHPGEVTFATETGSFTHLHVLAFEAAAGVSFNIVDAGTAANKTTELLGNRLDVIGTQAGLVRDYLTTGDFLCLGILADERLEGAPDIPTLKEQGYDVVFSKFFYLAAPNSVDDAVIEAMNAALAKVVDNQGLKDYALTQWVNISSMTAEETEAYYAEQYDLYAGYLSDYID
jgi:tripartite-type tricarboxylate transporter receptor subunit TctC